jgi:cytochrome b6-f complex iron-sulfur subunit
LDYFLGASTVAWLATVFYPIIRYPKPLPHASSGGPARLSPEQIVKLETGGFVIVPVSGKRVLVFKGASQEIVALDAKCTHEGCTVQYLPAESAIWCACHNARFDLDGRVVSGPPPRPLPKYLTERQEDGGILIVVARREND